MARMLYATNPGYRRRCKYAGRKSCTCYYWAYGRKVSKQRRKAARLREKAALRREMDQD